MRVQKVDVVMRDFEKKWVVQFSSRGSLSDRKGKEKTSRMKV